MSAFARNDRIVQPNSCEEMPPDLTESSGSEARESSEESLGNADDWDGIDASDTLSNGTSEGDGTSSDEDEEKLERDIAQGNFFFKNRQWSKAEVAYEDAIEIIKSRDLAEGEILILNIVPNLLMCYISLKKFGSAVWVVATVVDNIDASDQLSDPSHLYMATAMSLFGFVEHFPALQDLKRRELIELMAVYFAAKALVSDNDTLNETDENTLAREENLMKYLVRNKMCNRSKFHEKLSLIDFKATANEIRQLKFEETNDDVVDELVLPASKVKKLNSVTILKRAIIAFKAQKYDIATRYFKIADGEFTAKHNKDAALLTKYAIAKTFLSRDGDTKNPEEIIDMMRAITTLKEGRSFAPALLEQSKLYYENKMLAEAESLLHTSTLIVRSKGYVATNYTAELCSILPELDPVELEHRLDEYRDILHRHPKPLAICRFERCIHLPPHNTNPPRREMFSDDIGFKCFYELVCTEKCSVTLHQVCWKVYKENRGSANASERELLTSQCLTPDCKGIIAKIMKQEKDRDNPVKTWEADSDALVEATKRTSVVKVPNTNIFKDFSVKPHTGIAEKPTFKRVIEQTHNENKKRVSEYKITGTRFVAEPDVRVGGSVLQPKSASVNLEQSNTTCSSLGARSKVTSSQMKKSDEKIMTSSQNGQLVVGNLPQNCDEEDLRSLFCGFGKICAVQINKDIELPGPAKGLITFEEVSAVNEVLTYEQHSPICLSENQLVVEARIKHLMDVKMSQKTRDRIESSYEAKIERMRHRRKILQSKMDGKVGIFEGLLSQTSKDKVHIVDGKVVSANIDIDLKLESLETEIREHSRSIALPTPLKDGVQTITTSPTLREKELIEKVGEKTWE